MGVRGMGAGSVSGRGFRRGSRTPRPTTHRPLCVKSGLEGTDSRFWCRDEVPVPTGLQSLVSNLLALFRETSPASAPRRYHLLIS